MCEKHEWNADGHRDDVIRDEHKDGDYALPTGARHHAFTRALKHQRCQTSFGCIVHHVNIRVCVHSAERQRRSLIQWTA